MLKGWNIMRILRLGIGIIVVVQGFLAHDWVMVILGALFSLMPLFNVGCCAGSCSVPAEKNKQGKVEDVAYEEVR